MAIQNISARSPAFSQLSSGLRDILPLAAGVAVYGLAFGLLAAQASMDGLQTGVMGTIVFAGSSQIIAVERLVAGTGAGAAILAGLALNLRLLLITASLRDEYSGRPWWQVLLGVHLATDENWALMHAMRARGHQAGYWYLIGGGIGLIAVWVLSTVAGGHSEEKTVMPREGPDQRWHEYQAACHLRQPGPPAEHVRHRWTGHDCIGARALLSCLPDADWMLGDRGYDADWFREALKDKGIRACIPGRKQRKTPVRYDKRRYKRRHRPSRDIAAQCTAGQ